MRILVVDDEPDIAEFLRILLDRLGHEAAIARSGRDALRQLEGAQFDLIISDVRMPEMDGTKLYEELVRTNSPMVNRIMFVTGDEVKPSTAEFFARTKCFYLTKPYNAQQIKEALTRF